MDTSTNSQLLVDEYLSQRVLHRAEPELQVYKLGKKESIPSKNSKNIRWVRYAAISANVTPLTEGTTPSETAISTSDVECVAQQFGQWAMVTDQLEDTSAFNNLEQAADILGDGAQKSIETLCITELNSTAADQFADGVATVNLITSANVLDLEDLISAANSQASDYLPPHSEGCYAVVLHRSNMYDLLVDTSGLAFSDIMKHTKEGQGKIIKGELGELYGLRFYVSDLMTAAANTQPISVKSNYVMAFEPFGVVDIGNRGIQVMRTQRGPSDSDPLSQRQKVGYKMWFKAKYLQASSKRVIRVRAASGKG